jgi:DNA-directed RNA polymerase alpha subunit
MNQNPTTFEYIYTQVENMKNSSTTDSEVLILDRVLWLLSASKASYISEIELAKLQGKSELLKEMINQRPAPKVFDEVESSIIRVLKTKLVDYYAHYGISTRVERCMERANIETLGDLVSHKKSEILNIRLLGAKSFQQLQEIVDDTGLAFGMNVEKYCLNQN